MVVVVVQTAEFDIKKEAAWAISNATSGGTAEQIKWVALVERAGLTMQILSAGYSQLCILACQWVAESS